MRLTDEERFWPKVKKTDGCWLWTALIEKSGYGRFWYKGRMCTASRVVWNIVNGEIPDGLYVLHHCDVRNCVRPDHLFLGTKKDNSVDMLNKGRCKPPIGDRNGSRLHPERLARGDRNGMRLHPERVSRGEKHSKIMLLVGSKGSRHGSAKLNEEDIPKIRAFIKMKELLKDIGDLFGVSKSTISDIKNHKKWRHVV
jgi:hypothetical protein